MPCITHSYSIIPSQQLNVITWRCAVCGDERVEVNPHREQLHSAAFDEARDRQNDLERFERQRRPDAQVAQAIRALNVCDTCRTAFYDEGLIELDDEALEEVLPYGATIGDHVCELNGCQCPCSRPRRRS